MIKITNNGKSIIDQCTCLNVVNLINVTISKKILNFKIFLYAQSNLEPKRKFYKIFCIELTVFLTWL